MAQRSELGGQFWSARQRRGLTRQEVAERAGINRNTLLSLERGGNVTLDTLSAVAFALGLQVDIVLREGEFAWTI
jgi:transcriptional regulator with XRE-family HTH domain